MIMTFDQFASSVGKTKDQLMKAVYAKKGTLDYDRCREFGVIRLASKIFLYRGRVYKASSFARFIYQLTDED